MKRNQKQLWLSATLLLLLALLVAACGGQPEPPEPQQEAPAEEAQQESGQEAEEQPAEEPAGAQTTVTYWHTMSDAEEDALTEVIAMFEAEHPGIHVETTRFAYDDFKSALLTGLAGSQGPDTARLDIIWVPEFAELGALVALDEAMPNFQAIADNTFPGPLATNFWQGNYYGLPQDTNTQVLLWNQELFAAAGIDQPPQTLEEFQTVACELTAGEEQYGYALGGTYFWAPAPVFYAMGGQVVDEEITTADGYINSAESVAAFEMLDAMYDEGCLSPNLMGGGIGTSDGHATGLYAMITDGPWMVSIYENDYPEFEANFAPVPAGPDGSTSSVVGGQDVVVFAGSKNQDAALAWVEYLLSDAAQLKMAEAGVIPTVTSVRDNPDLPPYFGVFLDQMETAQARVPHPAWGDMDTAINNAFQRMLHGEQSPQEALDQAAEEINALLQ